MGFYGNSIIINEVSKEKASEEIIDSIIDACNKIGERFNKEVDNYFNKFKDSEFLKKYAVIFYNDRYYKDLYEKNIKNFKKSGSIYFFGAFEFPKECVKNGALSSSNITDPEEYKVFKEFGTILNKAISAANSNSIIKKYGEVYITPNSKKAPNKGFFVFQYKK